MNLKTLDVWIWIVQVLTTWYMMGLIWFVQMVHYPFLERLKGERFSQLHHSHVRWTNYVVPLPMLLEAITAAYLVYRPFPVDMRGMFGVGLGLVMINMGSTFLVQVPAHTKLRQGYDRETCRFLVRTNWIRTLAWSARGVLLAYMMGISS